MKLPVVAIVGRPNVGKSSLLNRFARERVSIVEKTPGVTRDRVSTVVDFQDRMFEVVDTGGIGAVDEADLGEHIDRQIRFAVEGADCMLFVVDARDGVAPLDREVAQRLRPRAAEVPLVLVVNKVDSPDRESLIHDFWELGLGEPVAVSAKAGLGSSALLERVVELLPETAGAEDETVLRLAVVGRRNAGKSTFVNALAREERMIVSEVPGTTRDAVDVQFEKDGRRFVIVDTAGVQRRRSIKSSVEFYSQARTRAALRRSDVTLFMLDASLEITRAEKRLAQTVAEGHHVCVLVANKWDLVVDHASTQEYADYLHAVLPGLRHAPVVFTTAKSARNVQSVIDVAESVWKAAARRVGTGELNRVIDAIRQHHRPPSKGGKTPKIYYATQVATGPPTIVLFVNEPRAFGADYRRYVEHALREALDWEEVPVRLFFRRRGSLYHD